MSYILRIIILIFFLYGCAIDNTTYPATGDVAKSLMSNFTDKTNFAANPPSKINLDNPKNYYPGAIQEPIIRRTSQKPAQSYRLRSVPKMYPSYTPEDDNPENTDYYLVPNKPESNKYRNPDNGFTEPMFKK